MARVSVRVSALRTGKLSVLKQLEDIIDETYYQTREEFCNNADDDSDLDWMDAKIEAALDKFKAEIEERLAEITDEVLNANAG